MKIFNSGPAFFKRQGFYFGISFKEWIASLLVFVVLAGLYFPYLLNGVNAPSGADLAIFFIPYRQLWVDLATQGHFPLWEPYTSSGNPFFATLQGAVLYPFSILYLFLDFFSAFNISFVLHYSLAGFFMYWLLRVSPCSRLGAAIGALTFMFGGYLFSLKFYLSTLFPVVWSSLLILCFLAGLKKNDRGLILAAALVSVFMIFAGGAETCYQIFAWLILFSFFPRIIFPNQTLPDLKNRLISLGCFFTFFLGMSAIQILPTMELVQNSIRSKAFDITQASSWSIHMQDWLQFILLDPFGYIAFPRSPEEGQAWMQSHYVGLIPLVLSGYFLLKGRRLSLAFILIGLVSWSLAMGKGSYVYQFFFEVLPGFDRFRYPVKFILPLILVLSISAAWGWDRIYTSNPNDMKKVLLLGFSALLMVLFGLIDIFNISTIQSLEAHGFEMPEFNQPDINLSNLQRLLGFSSLFFFFLFLMMKYPNKKNMWAFCAVFIFFLDIFFSNYGKQEINAAKNFSIVPPTTRFLMKDTELFRVFVTLETEVAQKMRTQNIRGVEVRGKIFPTEIRGQNRVEQFGGWNIIRKKSLRKILNQVGAVPFANRLPLLRMANVKYILHGNGTTIEELPLTFIEPPEYREALEKNVPHPPPLLRVYENPGYFGRAFLAGNCVVLPDGPQLNNAILDNRWDPEKWVILPESPPDLPCLLPDVTAKKGEGKVQITHWKSEGEGNDLTPGEYRMQVDSAQKQFLVLSDSFYPGWEAFVDGEQVTIHRANQAFRAIVMPEGQHAVEFRYRPKSFLYGAWISGITVIAGVAFVVVSTQRRRKNESSKGD
jgi:hypothetical protein